MKSTSYYLVLAWADATQTAAPALSASVVVALAMALPVTILVLVVGALAWRSVGLSPAGQEHTLKLMDRMAKIARAIRRPRGGPRS
ncbi:hypothetical protein ACIA49_38590 [Kribbella sp. NPDC051587]|uniref:hypothetical protein n=1 Tax=Kribbella sp. NPDC051587 TaxID=3364119 RepID=UPI0037A64C0F